MNADKVRERLAQLQEELRAGEARLRELTRQEAALRETLLRISGAAQVLHELLDESDPDPQANGATATALTVP
jgi:hypothetical protein